MNMWQTHLNTILYNKIAYPLIVKNVLQDCYDSSHILPISIYIYTDQ